MTYGTRAQLDAVRELAFGSISGTYAAVGTALTDHARIVRFVNGTDVQLYVSLDGSTNQIRMAANSFFLLDFSANKIRDDGLFAAIGTIFSIKQVSGAAGSGSFWIEVVSGAGGV